MQFMINTLEETPHTLRLAAQCLLDHATYIEAAQNEAQAKIGQAANPNVPMPGPLVVPTGTPSELPPVVPPAPSNVVPLVPPVPPVPAAASPVASTPNVPTPPIAPPAPIAPASSPAAPTVSPAASSASSSDVPQFDRAGMPWDERIHMSGKQTKKDGTYKIKRGCDPALVVAVTQELHAKYMNAATAGASPAPVSLPAAPQAPAAIPTPPSAESEAEKIRQENERRAAEYAASQGQAPAAVPPPPASVPSAHAQEQAAPPAPPVSLPPAVPVPPAPVVGMPDANNAGVVQYITDFRTLVAKIASLRNSGKFTGEEINGIVLQAGAPSMQLLGSMVHLVPKVDELIELALLTK